MSQSTAVGILPRERKKVGAFKEPRGRSYLTLGKKEPFQCSSWPPSALGYLLTTLLLTVCSLTQTASLRQRMEAPELKPAPSDTPSLNLDPPQPTQGRLRSLEPPEITPLGNGYLACRGRYLLQVKALKCHHEITAKTA